MGHIGKSLADFFSKSYRVMVFDWQASKMDELKSGIQKAVSAEALISQCDVIIGAIGIDVSMHLNLAELIKQDKTFISASSNDTEFNSLIRSANKRKGIVGDILKDLSINVNGHNICIIRGGWSPILLIPLNPAEKTRSR